MLAIVHLVDMNEYLHYMPGTVNGEKIILGISQTMREKPRKEDL